MLAIVLDENQHSRKVLSSMLAALGFTQTIECADLRDFDVQCSHYGNKIKLIISGLRQEEGLDFPLSRMVIQNSDLNSTALLFMTNRRFDLSHSFAKSRFSRIDSYLHRPFGLESLQNGVIQAFERRSEFRNVVLILNQTEDAAAIEACFADRKESHWEEAVFVHSMRELEAKHIEFGFKVGGIVLDSKLSSPSVRDWLKRMRKTSLGASTIISVLGRDPLDIRFLREEANLFFDSKEEWDVLLKSMSLRFRKDWEARFFLAKIRRYQKSQNFTNLKRSLAICKKRSLPHWEIEEQKGILALSAKKPEQAIHHFQKALSINPAAPSLYVRVIPQLGRSAKIDMIREAKTYCPLHPQIQQMSELEE